MANRLNGSATYSSVRQRRANKSGMAGSHWREPITRDLSRRPNRLVVRYTGAEEPAKCWSIARLYIAERWDELRAFGVSGTELKARVNR